MLRRFDPVPRDVLISRQRAAGERLDGGVLVLGGSPIRYRSRDTSYPYRPDSDLYWLTGLHEPGTIAVLRADHGDPELTVLVPPRDAEAELWDGHRLGPDEAAERAAAHAAYPLDAVNQHLPGLLSPCPRIFARLGAEGPVRAAVLSALRRARSRGPRSGTGPRAVVDPGEILDDLRMIKDDFEIARIREAARITVAGFRALAAELGRAGPGRPVPEWRLQGALEGVFRSEGGDGPAYESIVAGGSNACVLHYVTNDRAVPADGLVLVDAGSAFGLYAADITRTFPAGGRFTADQRRVYEVVEAARAEAVAVVAPGVPVATVHDTAVRALTRGLVEMGVLDRAAVADAGEGRDGAEGPDSHKPFFPHQTSHWLGLDVHDVGDYAVDGAPRLLEAGMVLTVEPGLYFGPAALEAAGDRARPYEGMGIRIEDDILVTPEGGENLTGALPTQPDGVEALVRLS